MASISTTPSGSGGGAISGVTVTGTAAASKVPVASSASAGAWAYPPGFEINYTEINSPVNVVGTTSAAPTTVLSPGAITFDGSAVLMTVFSPEIVLDTTAATDTFSVGLYESGSLVSMLGNWKMGVAVTGVPHMVCNVAQRFTPSAASHTYTVACWVTATGGTPSFQAGSGSSGGTAPAFVRFTKA